VLPAVRYQVSKVWSEAQNMHGAAKETMQGHKIDHSAYSHDRAQTMDDQQKRCPPVTAPGIAAGTSDDKTSHSCASPYLESLQSAVCWVPMHSMCASWHLCRCTRFYGHLHNHRVVSLDGHWTGVSVAPRSSRCQLPGASRAPPTCITGQPLTGVSVAPRPPRSLLSGRSRARRKQSSCAVGGRQCRSRCQCGPRASAPAVSPVPGAQKSATLLPCGYHQDPGERIASFETKSYSSLKKKKHGNGTAVLLADPTGSSVASFPNKVEGEQKGVPANQSPGPL
jgi:hypothetical protein